MRKLLHTLFTLLLIFICSQLKAQITLGTVDPGPYTPGSSIAATFTLGSTCITRTNRFDLYLSDASGNFVSTTPIGTYNGFYATFVNGVIPNGTAPGTGYRLQVRSTNPAISSSTSNAFTISAGSIVTASVTSAAINAANPETYGFCVNRTGANVFLTNASTAGGAVTANIVNELTGNATQQIVFSGNVETFVPGAAHYTMFVKVLMPDLTVATKAYFILNNVVNTAFSTTGSGLVCLPLGELSYSVDYQTSGGIQFNFPGNLYKITWGDDSEDYYTLCELKQSGNVTHNYTKSSCGSSFNGKFNVFGINISTQSPFCGQIGQPLSTSARVVTVTKNEFTGPAIGCKDTPITFINTSMPGQNQDDGSADCVDNNVRYNWYVNGQIRLANVDKATPFITPFNATGVYTIMLESVSSGNCQGEVFTKTICIQNPPQPSFSFPSTTICAGSTLTPANNSVIDNSCTPDRNFRWIIDIVSGGGPVTFAGGTGLNSETPQFVFGTAGVYDVSLAINTGACGEVVTVKRRVIVNTTPTATLSPNIDLCTPGALIFSDAVPTSPTFTTATGTNLNEPNTYTWTVSSSTGTYTISDPSAQFPTITFNDFATYTVTFQHTNNCGAAPLRTQVITFIPSPVITLPSETTICYIDQASLVATVSGSYVSAAWSGGTASGFSNSTSLNTTYTPTTAERNAGQVLLTLTLTTNLAAPCNTVAKSILIKIKPQITVTSASAVSICTNDATNNVPLNYTPTSNRANTTFKWTATGSAGTSGFNSGTGTIINDVLLSSDAVNPGSVTYTIIPVNDGCDGDPFTLTVTVTPRPVISATVADATICSNIRAVITLSSNLAGTTYTWTSVSTQDPTNLVTGNSQQGTPIAAAEINEELTNNATQQGSVIYTITPYSSTGCPGAPVTVTINVDPALTDPQAGPDQQICNLTTYTLDGNSIIVGTGTWSLTSGQSGVSFANVNDPKSGVTGLVAGETYVFRWTVTSTSACLPVYDDLSVIVNQPTIAGTTAGPATVCQGTNTGTITLSGNTGDVIRWEMSTNGGTTWAIAPNTTTTPNYVYDNLTESTLFRALVQNGQCNPENSTTTLITVTPADTRADAGPDQQLCNANTVTLTANTSAPLKAGESGLWELVPATPANPTVTIQNPTSPTTTVTGLVAAQTYTFRWTVTGPSACGPTNDLVVITKLPPIANNTVSSTSALVCSGQTITVNGSTPTGGNGTYTYVWESSTDGGNSWSTIANQNGQNLTFLITVTTQFRRTVQSGACPDISNAYNIVAQPPITNNTISANQTICTGLAPALLTGTVPQGSDGNFNYQWQLSTDGGNNWANIPAAVSATYQPGILTATTQYRRVVSTITCNGDQRNVSNAVIITVNPDARAEFSWTKDKDCAPFNINTSVITTVEYPDRNATYTWFANDVQIGTTPAFPGYILQNSNETVTIKLVVTPSTGCKTAEQIHVFSTNQNAAATYTQSATEGCGPLLVNFVNTSASIGEATFRWDFGNGTTSSLAQPGGVTYQSEPNGKDTTYTVTLTTITACGSASTSSTVFVKAKPISVFSPSRTEGCSPMRVTFSNTSPGGTNTYYYDFGDGTLLTKTDKSSVEHTYIVTATTDFVVKMIAENECGRDESSYVLRVSPQNITAELVVNANEKSGCAPLTVNFINNSIGASRFTFDFGDGGTLNTNRPGTVQHTYTRPGNYTVTMTAINSCSEIATTETIEVLPQPAAAFDANNTLGCTGLAVKFSNRTQDGFSYVWDFGDGTTSDEFEPTHVYNGDQEYYTVTLTATNTLGCSITVSRNQFIHIVQPPRAAFNVNPSTVISIPSYTFRFEDESTNNPTLWSWDFGDGTTSSLQNPSHTYADTGKYVVNLRVTNQQGCFTTTFKTVTIVGVPGYLYVPNAFTPGDNVPELRIFKAKGSGIKTWRMSVFNKWGQTLWETTELNEGQPVQGWDGIYNGVPVPQGVYFWKIDVEFVNGLEWKGMTYDSKAPKKTGPIHLIR